MISQGRGRDGQRADAGASARNSRRAPAAWSSLTAAVVALSCAFPLGAFASHLVIASAGSEEGVNVVRTVVAGIFTYMAVFELAPPHTHSRPANICYALCFTCGAAMAYVVDVVQQYTEEEATAMAFVQDLVQLVPNGTLT